MTIKECFEKIEVLNPLFEALIHLKTFSELAGFDININLNDLYDFVIKRIQSYFGYELNLPVFSVLKDYIKILVYIDLIKNYLKE